MLPKDKTLTPEEKAFFDELWIGTEKEVVENPYTKVQHELEPEAVALYDFIKGQEISLNQKYSEKGQDMFVFALGLFAKLWPTEYMDLLD